MGVRVERGWWEEKLYLSIHVNEHLAYCCLQKNVESVWLFCWRVMA